MTESHWDRVWNDREANEVSWYQSDPTLSLHLIEQVTTPDDGIIDVGAGAARLVDRLLEAGYTDLTVLDLASAALDAARQRLGASGAHVRWVVGDVTRTDLGRRFDLWHDRAVLHFLVDDVDRQRYRAALRRAVDVGAHVVLATFAPGAPNQCSGLPVRHYDPAEMQRFLGSDFEALEHHEERHETPGGDAQPFVYGLYRRTVATTEGQGER